MIKIIAIVFRECLEISIILSIIYAVTNGIKNRSIYIIAGIMSGMFGASIVALLANQLTTSFMGIGDELLDCAVILLTSMILGYTVIWTQDVAAIKGVIEPQRFKIDSQTLAVVVATTMFREFSEIVLLVKGVSLSFAIEAVEYVTGVIIGICGALSVSVATYFFLGKIATNSVFFFCSTMLTLISAGLAAEAVGILNSIGIISILDQALWDTSGIISDQSIIGKLLKITIGYVAKPTQLQIATYFGVIIIIIMIKNLKRK